MLEACPWCGTSTNLVFERHLSAHWVKCSCGASGPIARNDDFEEGRETSEDLWNIRAVPREQPVLATRDRLPVQFGFGFPPKRKATKHIHPDTEIDFDELRARFPPRDHTAVYRNPEELVAATRHWLINPDEVLMDMKGLDKAED